MAKMVSLREIARVAGVSVSAVSQILNDKEVNFCSETTKEKVRQTARDLGYQPNFGYKLMHSQKTHTVAIVITAPSLPQEEHIKQYIIRLLSEFERLNYTAFCGFLPQEPAAARNKVQQLASRGAEHFVFLDRPFGFAEIFADLDRQHITAISMREETPRYVSNGSLAGSEMILGFLKEETGSDFRLVCETNYQSLANQRIMALGRLFPERSFHEILRDFIFDGGDLKRGSDFAQDCYEFGYESMKNLLAMQPDLRGVAFMNDSIAIGGAALLLKEQYRKFRHIKVTGFNFNHAARYFPFPISTIEFDIDEIIRLLVKNALTFEPCQIKTTPILHIRKD